MPLCNEHKYFHVILVGRFDCCCCCYCLANSGFFYFSRPIFNSLLKFHNLYFFMRPNEHTMYVLHAYLYFISVVLTNWYVRSKFIVYVIFSACLFVLLEHWNLFYTYICNFLSIKVNSIRCKHAGKTSSFLHVWLILSYFFFSIAAD